MKTGQTKCSKYKLGEPFETVSLKEVFIEE